MSAQPQKKRRALWIIPAAILLLAAAAWAGLALYAGGYARAEERALACMAQDAARDGDGLLCFGAPSGATGLILYPGGLVDEAAYAPLASLLAQEGVFVAIPAMPYHLAVFGMDRADAVMAQYPGIETWYVGGHSLGGAMAASYAAAHPAQVAGVVLLAAYSTEPLSLPVLSVYGENDTVLDWEKLAQYRGNLPKDAVECVIPGGNHAQFGDYGAQDGDSAATISAAAQQEITARAILDWIAAQTG